MFIIPALHMKYLSAVITSCILFNSCGSKEESTREQIIVPQNIQQEDVSAIPQVTTEDQSVNNSIDELNDQNKRSTAEGYNEGYSFGYDMGYIDGEQNNEYSGVLPVGPNAASFTYDYRRGYAAGYSAGYEAGQQASNSGIYSVDEIEIEYEDDEEYYDDF